MTTFTECPQCKRSRPCLRLGVKIEGRSTDLQATMLLCTECLGLLWAPIYGMSVARTPRDELDEMAKEPRPSTNHKEGKYRLDPTPIDNQGKPSRLRERMKWRRGL